MLCPGCQSENAADARFCSRCGRSFSTTEPTDSGTLLKIEPGTPDPQRRATEHKKVADFKGDPAAPQHLGNAGPGGRYELLELLGRGGMGSVFKARDKNLGRVVALKRVRQLNDTDSEYQRFEREAQSIARMQHPNVVTVHDFGRDEQGPYLVMEYVEGETLAGRLARRGALPPAQASGVMAGLCAGLAHAHSKGVIHRDIKPANVIIDEAGVPKLLDFGLASDGTDSTMSQTGWFLGTPDYAAPEQKLDAKNVDHRADIYSLGTVLYEMLTGKRPVPLAIGKLPLRWQFVVGKACEPEPADRYQSVADMLAVVRNIPLEAAPSVPAAPTKVGFNELACPDCGADNTLAARACVKCKASLDTTCILCGGRRRTGIRECTVCHANVVLAGIAISHKERAERALAERLCFEAAEELTQLDFMLQRAGDQLAKANDWAPWVRTNLAGIKRDADNARKLAEKARDANQRGLQAAAVTKMGQAASLDARFHPEFLEFAAKAGVDPILPARPSDPGPTRSLQKPTTRLDLAAGPTKTLVSPGLTRANMKVRCKACNSGFLTRKEVIEKQTACPKCGKSPFEWVAQGTT